MPQCKCISEEELYKHASALLARAEQVLENKICLLAEDGFDARMRGGNQRLVEDDERELRCQQRLDYTQNFDLAVWMDADHQLEQRLQMERVGDHLVEHVEHTGNLWCHVREGVRQEQKLVDEKELLWLLLIEFLTFLRRCLALAFFLAILVVFLVPIANTSYLDVFGIIL